MKSLLFPASLALRFFCCSASSILEPDRLVPFLTETNFTSTITNGYWFVEHLLPECGHCQDLAPIWSKLAEDHEPAKVVNDFHFGRINCVDERPLCVEHNVHRFPALILYKDGNPIADYEEVRTYTGIDAFIRGKKVENPNGQVVQLHPENFEKMISNGPWFIEFFSPKCYHCIQLAPVWEKLGAELKEQVNVGKVDCIADRELCDKFDVQGYPTLKMFHDGQVSADYRLQRDLPSLAKFARDSSSRPQSIDVSNFDDAKIADEASFLLLHNDINLTGKTRALYNSIARTLSSQKRFYESTDVELAKQLHVTIPSLVVIKDGKTVAFPKDLENRNEVEEWIGEQKYPLVAKLDRHNSQEYLEGGHTIVLSILSPKKNDISTVLEVLRKVSGTHAERPTKGERSLFAWIDGDEYIEYVSRAYGATTEQMPLVVILRPHADEYYDTDGSGKKIPAEQKSLLATLDSLEKGQLKPKSSIGYGVRLVKQFKQTVSETWQTVAERPVTCFLGLGMCIALLVYGWGKWSGDYMAVGQKAE